MKRTFLFGKVHRVTVTGADLEYEGSLTLDAELMEAAHFLPYQRIEVYDVTRKSHTTLKYEKLEYNLPMKDDDFTLQALRRDL